MNGLVFNLDERRGDGQSDAGTTEKRGDGQSDAGTTERVPQGGLYTGIYTREAIHQGIHPPYTTLGTPLLVCSMLNTGIATLAGTRAYPGL